MIEWHKNGVCNEGCSPCDSDGHVIEGGIAFPIYSAAKLAKIGVYVGKLTRTVERGANVYTTRTRTRYIEVREGFFAVDDTRS